MKNKVSLFGKISRLKKRLADAEWRRYGTLLLMGKFVGVALLLLGAILLRPDLMGFGSFAADPQLKGNDIVNPVNTVWTLIAAFLVFGMQVGFTMLEAGFCRSRETVNVLMECIVDTCLCGILFYAMGLRLHVQPRQRLHRLPLVLPAGTRRPPMKPRASRFWRSGSSSLPSPIPAPRLPPAR